MMQLLAPDGYYVYLKIDKSTSTDIDEDLIKKNYRKLSLKHHPGTFVFSLRITGCDSNAF
jgi:DnaJ-class molecular chaperone